MTAADSTVTIHMVASLDGFIARRDGIPFFAGLDKDIALHLVEVKAYKSGLVAHRHVVRGQPARQGGD